MDDVVAVGIEVDHCRLLDDLQGLDGGSQFSPLVGRVVAVVQWASGFQGHAFRVADKDCPASSGGEGAVVEAGAVGEGGVAVAVIAALSRVFLAV